MVLHRDKLKIFLKEKSCKYLDEVKAFLREVSMDVSETLHADELTGHSGCEKYGRKCNFIDSSGSGCAAEIAKSKFAGMGPDVSSDLKSEFKPLIEKNISGLKEKTISCTTKKY